MNSTPALDSSATMPAELFVDILRGYRFTVCTDAAAVARAVEVRRRVYVEGSGYAVSVPDQYDCWSWILLAEDVQTGEPVGTLRLTPRAEGPLEAEEYFRLPADLRSPRTVELTRLAILPAHRKSKTFVPAVSIGLFKLAKCFLEGRAEQLVVCSKPERIWTYDWLGFDRTGLSARYTKLNDAEHELLRFDYRRVDEILGARPFGPFFVGLEHGEIVLPRSAAPVGLHDAAVTRSLLLRRSA